MSIQTNYLDIDVIRIDGGTQSRAHLNQETIKEYADLIKNSDREILPPIRVFYDGNQYWLADGFHRVEASKQAGWENIAAIVEQGTVRDAILFSVGANAEHGLRRTEDDKRRAVNTLLTDDEWNNWSDNQIAKKCKVSQPFVSKLRKELAESTGNVTSKEKRTYERNGKTHTMRTNNIGKSQPIQETQEPDKNPNTKEMFGDNQSTEQSEPSYNVISKEEKIATLNKRLDICQDEYAQKSIEYITDLEKKLEEANQKIATLTETNNQLFTANENLTKELNELKQKNTSLTEEVKKLKESISQNDNKIKEIKRENSLLEGKISMSEELRSDEYSRINNIKERLENTLEEIQSIFEIELSKKKEVRFGKEKASILLNSIKETLGAE